MLMVEVVFVWLDCQEIVLVKVLEGIMVVEVVKLFGIVDIFLEIDFDIIDMGIFGKVIKKLVEYFL